LKHKLEIERNANGIEVKCLAFVTNFIFRDRNFLACQTCILLFIIGKAESQ